MSDDTYQFKWRVCLNGYSWWEDEGAGENAGGPDSVIREIAPDDPDEIGFNFREYNPLENSALFRIFAETPLTKEGILGFVQEYGPLGSLTDAEVQVAVSRQEEIDGELEVIEDTIEVQGESFVKWTRELEGMRAAIELWERARRGEVSWLKGRFYDLSKKLWLQRGNPNVMFIHLLLREEAPMSSHDVLQYALDLVQAIVNDRLRGQLNPRLVWEKQPRVRLGLKLTPDSLLGALWLQFAEAIDGNKEFRQCPECGKWLEFSPEAARANKRFCSSVCRVRHYRRRQEEAIKMDAAGVPLKEIASQLDSDEETVSGWIKKGKSAVPQTVDAD